MVPYVRKSFKKHLKDGFSYITKPDAYTEARLASDEEIGIEDEELQKSYPAVYKYAYDMTEKETCQAVEGMYHNLNMIWATRQ